MTASESTKERVELVSQLLDERYPGGRLPVAYEVDDAAGRCLYRGTDLELACEIHDQDAAAHLSRCVPVGHIDSSGTSGEGGSR
jgi:hypothetical protein